MLIVQPAANVAGANGNASSEATIARTPASVARRTWPGERSTAVTSMPAAPNATASRPGPLPTSTTSPRPSACSRSMKPVAGGDAAVTERHRQACRALAVVVLGELGLELVHVG